MAQLVTCGRVAALVSALYSVWSLRVGAQQRDTTPPARPADSLRVYTLPPADAPRRPGSAHQSRARRGGSDRGAARPGVGAVRERDRWGDQHLDRPDAAADGSPGRAGAVRDVRPRSAAQLEQVAVEYGVSRRFGERPRDCLATRLHGPAATLGR